MTVSIPYHAEFLTLYMFDGINPTLIPDVEQDT